MRSHQNLTPTDRKKSTSHQHLWVPWLTRVIQMVLTDRVLSTILQVLVWFPSVIIRSKTLPRNQVFHLSFPYPTGHYPINKPFLFLEIHG